MFENIPNVKLGLIAVFRDCFPRTLSEMRRANIAKACEGGVYECPVTVENEADMLKAVADVKAAECNALVVFLGNFGPETPETLIAKYFDGPCMFVAAAEGDGDLINGRGDAYCGMLNCSYNLGMRHLKSYIPEYPVGTAADITKMIADFIPIARAVIGVKNLKIIAFGPRPQDFFACNAPIKGLYELGVEIEENSELDLLVSYKAHAGDARIPAVCEDMKREMGEGRYYEDLLVRMAQFELTLLDWAEGHKGARKYVAFADKCWPAFPEQFGFEPCYVNSRLASRGIEKSFDDLKNELDMKRLRIHTSETAQGKVFVSFLSLIVRSYLLKRLKDYMRKTGLTLKKILLELDKIKTIQYPGSEEERLLNPLTKQQREIYELLEIPVPECRG